MVNVFSEYGGYKAGVRRKESWGKVRSKEVTNTEDYEPAAWTVAGSLGKL